MTQDNPTTRRRKIKTRAAEADGAPVQPAPKPDVVVGPPPERVPAWVSAAACQPCEVKWVQPGYLPEHAVTIVEGRKGAGKSLLAAAWAKKVQDRHGTARTALLWSTIEEHLHSQTRPRLEAAGCDLACVLFPGADQQAGVITRPLCFPADFHRLRQLVIEVEAELLILDPLSSHVSSSINLNIEQQARAIMDPLSALAAELSLTVVCLRHLRKGAGHAIDAGLGSVALAASARSVVLVRRTDDTSGRRIVQSVACNLGPEPKPQLCEILQAPNGAPRLTWVSNLEPGAPELEAKPVDAADRDALADAIAFLRAELGAEEVPVNTIKDRADKAAISLGTLRRAKQQLQVEAIATGARESRVWLWRMPCQSGQEQPPGA